MTRFPIYEDDQLFSFRQLAAVQAILANPVRNLRRWWLRPFFWLFRFRVDMPDGPVYLSRLESIKIQVRYAAFRSPSFGRNPGYHARKVWSKSSLRTWARI